MCSIWHDHSYIDIYCFGTVPDSTPPCSRFKLQHLVSYLVVTFLLNFNIGANPFRAVWAASIHFSKQEKGPVAFLSERYL